MSFNKSVYGAVSRYFKTSRFRLVAKRNNYFSVELIRSAELPSAATFKTETATSKG